MLVNDLMLSTGVAFLRNKDLMKFTHKPDIRERERETETETETETERDCRFIAC